MFTAGVARREITPFWGVELTGWGYYIERRWQRIADPLFATALAVDDGERPAVLLTLDLMLIDAAFTERTRAIVSAATGLPASAILLTCSHSHNAPAAGGLLGVGECDPQYEQWASRQAATAAILAWINRVPAKVSTGHADVPGISFNRTRAEGVVDSRLTVLRIDAAVNGRAGGVSLPVTSTGGERYQEADASRSPTTLAIVVGFGAHPTVTTELQPWAVSRDVPGMVCDGLEAAFPGALALYVQGACGDVNFLREYVSLGRCGEPAAQLVAAALHAIQDARPVEQPIVFAARATAELPTRRWRLEEIEADRREAEHRLATGDISRWRETIGRAMTNRPDDMVRRHGGDEHKAVRAMCRFHREWTEQMLKDVQTREEVLRTEVQALRIGDLYLAANSSEFFSPFALDVRQRAEVPELMFACYANGRIGYLPDAYDIAAKSYAGYQSPKYCNQFPFIDESGPAMCDAMLGVIRQCQSAR